MERTAEEKARRGRSHVCGKISPSQAVWPHTVPQVGIMGEGVYLTPQSTHSGSDSEAGVGKTGEFQKIMSCWKGSRRLFSFPSPVTVAFAGTVPPHLSCTVTGGPRST